MLDSFIINRIRKEREERERAPLPLRIEQPRPELPQRPGTSNRHQGPGGSRPNEGDNDKPNRGSVIIDFKL